MYSNELKSFCTKISCIKLSVTKNPIELDFKEKILKATNFLPEEYKLTTRYFCILNDIQQIPLCEGNCGNFCIPNKLNAKLGFTRFHSDECARQNRIPKHIEEKLKDYDWLYNQRITLKKSKIAIGKEIGCSETLITKWIKFHNIPEIWLQECDLEVQKYLDDIEWFKLRYKEQLKSPENISNELLDLTGIKVSRGLIWRYVSKHKLEPNPSNIYDRKFIKTSKGEQEVIDFIKSIYDGKIIIENRTIFGCEIDIYIPDKKIAIEYNGVYRHLYNPSGNTDAERKGRNYHLNKTICCENSGIELFHIWSSSWENKKEIWKSRLTNKLNLTTHKVYAKNCIIKEITTKEKNIFLNQNHLQGEDKSKIKIGLFNNDELLSVATFSPSVRNQNYDWELKRFASKLNTNVVGGFSKILSYFRKHYKGSIITYADRTYSNGNLYTRNNFICTKLTQPSYYYVAKNTEILIHKSNFMKSKIGHKDDPKTEEEIMFEKGYSKIWDCGLKVFVLEA